MRKGPGANVLAAITRHDRLQHIFPAIGAVDIAGAQGASFQIAELVEDEQRMIAGSNWLKTNSG